MSEFRNERKLYRNRKRGVVGGICAGLADYFDVDVVLVRIIAITCLFFTLQVAFIAYWVAYFVLNDDPKTLTNKSGHLKSKFRNSYQRKAVFSSVHDRFRKVETRIRTLEAYVTSPRFKLSDEIDSL
ncbi:envelope stress response membrane protein PspC [Teredinibacter purpureus]|jgi:phage shock protein C|uniref:envelope stress response membrane protein PspC n=1 Tax=Teredinibacter purpureus TaxID=2731756 RepID=UPI0005F82D60|nr:envelope stress response membrane protein PspC [Teredinibacter purpureus]